MNRVNKTRFMEQEECKRKLRKISLMDSDIESGGIPYVVEGDMVYIDSGENHTIVFGATGSRKTRGLVMPTIEILTRAGESFVVTDPKGELFQKSAGYAGEKGYQILVINLRELSKGMAWNPLLLPYDYYHTGMKNKALELLSETMEMLVTAEGENDSFWMNSSKDVLVGLVLVLFECAVRDECHLKSLISLWDEYKSNKEALQRYIKENCMDMTIMRKLSCLYNASDRTVGSIEAFVDMGLNKLVLNEKLVEVLSRNEINLNDITEKKTAVYLIVPDENTHYHFIVSLFLEQLYEVLIKKAYQTTDNRLAIRMNFMIDEFANLPQIENMDSMITAARSRNIRFFLIVQSMGQLKQKYEKTAEVICGNCNNWIYLYSKEYELLQEISRLCGEVIYDNNMKLPLISEFDLQHLDKEKGEALVLLERNNPCVVNFSDISQYPFEQVEIELPQREDLEGEIRVFCLQDSGDVFMKKLSTERIRRKMQCTLPMLNTHWLVGSFHGMIMVEGFVSPRETEGDSGKALLCRNRFHSTQEMDSLDWEVMGMEQRRWYKEMLTKYPERIFLTINEVKQQRLEEHNPGIKYYLPLGNENPKRYMMELVFCGKHEPVKYEMGYIPYYNGVLGAIYANHILFHGANMALKETDVEKLAWNEYAYEEYTKDVNPRTDFVYWKRQDREQYVIARLICQG